MAWNRKGSHLSACTYGNRESAQFSGMVNSRAIEPGSNQGIASIFVSPSTYHSALHCLGHILVGDAAVAALTLKGSDP